MHRQSINASTSTSTAHRSVSLIAMIAMAVALSSCDGSSAPTPAASVAPTTNPPPAVQQTTNGPAADERTTAAAPVAQATAPPAARTPSAPPVRVGPVLLNRQIVDFGVVAPHTEVEAEVSITNAIDQPLKIIGSVPSCQCTTVDMVGVVIAPGESVPMPMSMKTGGSTGIKLAGVTLVFEGHDTPVVISIRSEVAYSVRAMPPFIDVQQARRDAKGAPLPPLPLSGTIVLDAVDGKPFRILGLQGEAPSIVDFDPERDEPRSRYQLNYDLTEAHREGRVPTYMIVETDRADCPAVDLRVRHETTHIRPSFQIGEFRSAVGLIRPGETGQFDLEIKSFGTRRIVEVNSKEPTVATTRLLGQKPDGQNLLITVEVLPAPTTRGLLYFPVTIRAADGATTDLIVFGRVAD